MRDLETSAVLAGSASRPLPAATYDLVTGRYAVAGRGVVPLSAALGYACDTPQWRVGASRLYELVPANTLPFEYDRVTGALRGLAWLDQETDYSGTIFSAPINGTLTPNAALGPDGLLSAAKMTPAVGTATHGTFGNPPLVTTTGLPYTVAGSFASSDFSFLRGYFDAGKFPDDGRSAIFNMASGAPTKQDQSTRLRVVASPSGAPGWWDFELTAAANASGNVTGAGFHLTGSGTSTSATVSGDGLKSYACWGLRLTQAGRSPRPLPPGQYRAAPSLFFKDLPYGEYEVLVYGQGRVGAFMALASSQESLGLPNKLPSNITMIERIEVYPRGKIRALFRGTKMPEAIPARDVQFKADQGETRGAGADIAALSGGAGITATQATVSKRPAKVILNGKGLWRASDTAGTSMVCSGLPALSSPTVFSWAMNIRPLADQRGIVWGALGQINTPSLGCDAGYRPYVQTNLAIVAKGQSSIEWSAGMSQIVYVRDGDRQSLWIDGDRVPLEGDLLGNFSPATNRILFCEADGILHFNGYVREFSRWNAALTDAQAVAVCREMEADTREVVVPSADLFSTGAPVPDGFTTSSYVSGPFPTYVEAYALSDTGFTAALARTNPITPEAKQGPGAEVYYPVKHDVRGLPSNAWFRWILVVDGVKDFTKSAVGRTAPAYGVPTPSVALFASCFDPSYVTSTVAPCDVMIAQNADFTMMLGDNGYTNDPTPTVEAKRKAVRFGRRNVSMRKLYLAGVCIEIPDDHDLTPNDWELGKVYGGQPGTVMAAACTEAWTETVPHFPLWDEQKRNLSFHFDWGTHRVIVLDTRFLQQLSNIDVPTVIGRGLNSFDLEGALLDNLASMPSYIQSFQFVSPTGYPGYNWSRAPDELRVIEEAIARHRCNADGMTGDGHYRWVDDGGVKVVSPLLRMPRAMASPTYHAPISAEDQATRPVHYWDGVPTNDFYSRQFIRQDRAGDGSFVYKCFTGSRASPAPVLKLTKSVSDKAPTLTVLPASQTVRPGRGVMVEKTWFGPYGVPLGTDAAAVDYTVSGVGSGQLRYGPNLRVAETAPIQAPGTYSLVLSNPMQAGVSTPALLPVSTFPVAVVEAAALAAFLAAGPSGAVPGWRSVYRDLFYGAEDAGLLSKLEMLHFYAAGDATLARTNLVAPGTFTHTPVAGISHAPGVGFTSDGTGYLNTGFNPGDGGAHIFTPEHHAFGIRWDTEGTSEAWAMGGTDFGILPRNAEGNMLTRSASSNSRPNPVETAAASISVIRNGADEYDILRDDAAPGAMKITRAVPSTPTPSEEFQVFTRRGNDLIRPGTVAYSWAGAMTTDEAATLDALLTAAWEAARALA